jgi:predicted metalloprotease with PDZ domain
MRKLVSMAILVVIARFASADIRLVVDATGAPRRVLHAALNIPAAPGPLTLVYPKWIPGEHEPSGPIDGVTALRIEANGQPLRWTRDALDLYAFHCDVPQGASSIDVRFDYLSRTGPSFGFANGRVPNATDRIAIISWNTVVLYPEGTAPIVAATLRLPAEWTFATALSAAHTADDHIDFTPVPLETLVDSPVLAGRFMRTIELKPDHLLHIAAESPDALEARSALISAFGRMIDETSAVFGPAHYRRYHFLLALSDELVEYGLEHLDSSDNRYAERSLVDEQLPADFGDLLPHELVHSWNGKFIRPAGLTTTDFQQPMSSDLLWVYEGLTSYYGYVIAARSGLLAPDDFRDTLARYAAYAGTASGREWRSLEDVSISSQMLEPAPPEWRSRRRGLDYYGEGALFWLEVESIIRAESRGARSLDDFARSFFTGKARSYTLADVAAALDRVAHYDWQTFIDTRIRRASAPAPIAGIAASGWRLDYNDRTSSVVLPGFLYSLGISVKDATVADVIESSPADRAGVAPGMTLLAVNGRRFTADRLHHALAWAKSSGEPVELLIMNNDAVRSLRVDYRGGDHYPHLVRDTTRPDLLEKITAPRAH